MSRVVDGAEPMEFKALFKAWRDKYENTGIGKKYSGEVASTEFEFPAEMSKIGMKESLLDTFILVIVVC